MKTRTTAVDIERIKDGSQPFVHHENLALMDYFFHVICDTQINCSDKG